MIGFEDKKGDLKIRKSRNVRLNEIEIYFKQKKTQKLVEDIDNDSNEVSFLCQLAIGPLLPKNVDEALQNPNWFEAMNNEYDSLVENNVWSLVKSDEEPVGSRWHFALKFAPDCDICPYKARFVAKGFSQVFGNDFYETYSPTTRLSTIRILMSLALSNDYQLKQMDIKTAYLNAPIEEDVVIFGKPGTLVSDGGGEYITNGFRRCCRNQGIRFENSAPYTPQEKGKIERIWGTSVAMACCLLDNACLDKKNWTHALNMTFCVKNMLLHSALEKTLFEMMYNEKPDLSSSNFLVVCHLCILNNRFATN